MIPAYVYGFFTKGYHTAAIDAAIDEPIPGQNGMRLALLSLEYLCLGTPHLASFMYAKDAAAFPGSSRNSALLAAVPLQPDIICAVTPKDPAGTAAAVNDIVAYQLDDGTWEFNTVLSLTGDVLKMNTNLVGTVAIGGRVMVFGIVADGAVLNVYLTASVVTRKGEGNLTIVHPYMSEPFYLSIDNITAAGFLEHLVMGYINK